MNLHKPISVTSLPGGSDVAADAESFCLPPDTSKVIHISRSAQWSMCLYFTEDAAEHRKRNKSKQTWFLLVFVRAMLPLQSVLGVTFFVFTTL